ncbi:hypothetical protein [Vitreimonas flagellata]|uniref:hypothetical protein n=1 Tax=Vitreimonas flagellata TaxID=2560861 RepID=UPI001EF7D7A7|nr:hypothetical protein [Vitreimonas flagellata]
MTNANAFQFANDESNEEWVSTGGGGREPSDYCSREGAVALKAKIEAYWRERGQDVMIALHNVGFHPAIRAARYDVRSDMVNGMPRKRSAGAAAPKETFVEEFDVNDDDLSFE